MLNPGLTNNLPTDAATESKQDAIIAAIASLGGTLFDSRFDDTGTHMYVAEANPGTADAAASWRIKRYVSSSLNGYWADGVATFTKVWNDRATYSY